MKSLFALSTLFALSLTPTQAFACSCVPFDYQAVYARGTGVMVAVPRASAVVDDGSPFPSIRYDFEVGKIYQGPVEAGVETLSLTTASDGAACGQTFVLDQAALVWFYDRGDGSLGTNLCLDSGTLASHLTPYRWLEAQERLR